MLKQIRKRTFEDFTFTAAISTPRNILVSCLEDKFIIFDSPTLKKSSYNIAGSSRCVALDYARADAKIFLSGDFDGVMRLWDLKNPRRPISVTEAGRNFLPTGATFNCVSISPDSRFVCAGSCLISGKRKQTKKKVMNSKRPRFDLGKEFSLANDDDDDDENESVSSAFVVCWDTRQMVQPLLMLNDIHSDDINHLVFEANHSSSTSRLLSCADDGLVCLTDLNASSDDRLIEVFNAERQVNYCGFLNSSKTGSGVYAFDNMRSHFTAWPLNSEEDAAEWQKLKTPDHARYLLSATCLPGSQTAVCLLSTSAIKQDLRISLAVRDQATIVAKRRLFKKELALDSDAFYADVVSLPSAMNEIFEVLAVTRHSIHQFHAKMA